VHVLPRVPGSSKSNQMRFVATDVAEEQEPIHSVWIGFSVCDHPCTPFSKDSPAGVLFRHSYLPLPFGLLGGAGFRLACDRSDAIGPRSFFGVVGSRRSLPACEAVFFPVTISPSKVGTRIGDPPARDRKWRFSVIPEIKPVRLLN
jgi:hypothetical protein